ncbi:MAG TPA: hypothetical protein PKC39_08620 [Ferruginibacter sp.]|nr:hypothetical protein [Ferruginibacter sp.]HMP21007.1 hypothetical protein [Ferruginibacter sp.]
MSSKIDKFIRTNREAFDDAELPEALWQKVEAQLPVYNKKKVVTLRHMYRWMAAAVVVGMLLTSVYFMYLRTGNTTAATASTGNPGAENLSGISPEYTQEAMLAYKTIEAKQEELKAITADKPELYRQFLSDLRMLDSAYNMLQQQALNTPNRDVIVKAMLQNLQLQMELLGRQLMIMNTIKDKKTLQHEKTI